MKTNLLIVSILAAVFVFVFTVGSYARAEQTMVNRDLGVFHIYDSNSFGDDRAASSLPGAVDRDTDARINSFVPQTYGLMGNYGRLSGQ